ncbi:hypothetical protein RA280_40845 [Cupriavidus sp. CV2]|uniref:hypothetical protein n=1 Tax=Cupriavidus ulmosensis TaxID=3065913 RepID=UPI00296B223B|nr:hypothetical protein [Cupriavidus sp. CV2]MDW3687969.1 hypothetical protein [Cupriavidus sp. CV2]
MTEAFLPLLGPILPELTDEDAASILDYLHEMVTLLESHYHEQNRRHALARLRRNGRQNPDNTGASMSITTRNKRKNTGRIA